MKHSKSNNTINFVANEVIEKAKRQSENTRTSLLSRKEGNRQHAERIENNLKRVTDAIQKTKQ